MLIRLVIQIIYISWNRNIKRKIIIFNCTKLWFYVQIKYLIKDHGTDQVQKAKTVLSAVSLIFVISIGLFYLSLFHRVVIYWSLSIEQVRTCNLISHICVHVFMYVCMYVCISPVQMFLSGSEAGDSNGQQKPNLVLNRSLTSVKLAADISL